jgi:hypothetical protein
MAGKFYQSLRIIDVVHKLRYGVQPKLVEASSEQTIERKRDDDGFLYFEVMPSGVQIPAHNVASAIPVDASIANKVNRTVGAMKQAREAKLKAAQEKANAAE